MVGQTISHYRVLNEIGGGGMGVVYRAEDTRLGRQVALKFLPDELTAAPGAVERFRREAELISSLNHPHICTLYDIGEHQGRQFLVLELVEGETLTHRLAGRALPIDRVISLGIDLAEALDAAHAKGIVHRDVKPGNVLITANAGAKLLDFGIAKRSVTPLAGDQDRQVTQAAVTRAGDWIGTPDYMAPEQVRGEPVDARTDVFALGAVLFEMATGRPPFAGPTVTATVDAVLHRQPAKPAALNPEVSAELERIILKALEKDTALRYQTTREIATDLRRLMRDTGTDTARSRRRVVAIATAAVLFVLAAAAWLIVPRLREPPPAPGSTGAGVSGPSRLVVLPFENMTAQSGDDWIAGAFADAVTAGLQPIETLILVPRERVVELYAAESRRESQALSSTLAREVSNRLKVRYYVHGSYQRVGDDLRVSARLVDMESGAQREQETVTGRFANVLSLQDELATKLARRLSSRVGAVASSGPGTTDVVANQLVSDARAHYALGQWGKALPLLDEAVRRDSNYALAWAMLSKTHARMIAPASASAPDPAVVAAALREAKKAEEIAPTLVQSQIALALAQRNLWQIDAAREAAGRAVTIDPRNGEARVLLADSFSMAPAVGCPVGWDADRAIQEYREALSIDPFEAWGYSNLTTLLWWMGRREEALHATEQGLAARPGFTRLVDWHPFNLAFAGRVDEADAILARRAGPSITGRDEAIHGYIALARKQFAEADRRFRNADAQGVFGTLAITLITSVAQFQAGRPDQGGAYLARGVRARPECAVWAMEVPALAPFKHLPEFKAAIGQR